MGQGHYTAIFWGSIWTPPNTDEGEWWYAMLEDAAVEGVQFRRNYETDEEWQGFLVADCGQGISWKDKAVDICRHVFDLAALPGLLETVSRFTDAMRLAKESYARLQATAGKCNVAVPDGRLLLVNDWD